MGNRSRSNGRPLPIENNIISMIPAPDGLIAHFRTGKEHTMQPVLCLAIVEFCDEVEGSKVRDIVPMICGGIVGIVDATCIEAYLGVAMINSKTDYDRVVASKELREENASSEA